MNHYIMSHYKKSVDRFQMPKTREKRKPMKKKKKMRCCRCGRSSGCWFRDQQRSQDRKGPLHRGGERRGWFTDFHGSSSRLLGGTAWE